MAPDAIELEAAGRLAVRLAAGDGRRSEFMVEPVTGADERWVRVTAAIAGRASHRRTIPLCPQTLVTDLDRALSTPQTPDGPWRRALSWAAARG
jgi:hypothetical protein